MEKEMLALVKLKEGADKFPKIYGMDAVRSGSG